MFWRTLIFAFLAVGALASLELTEQYRESISSKLNVCNKAGGDAKDNAAKLTDSLQSFFDCVYPIVDTGTLEAEIDLAKSNGTVNEVIEKYCAKTPELKTCLHTLIDAASPCVAESVKDQLTLAKNSTDLFIDYLCYNDGIRITPFLTENGPECVQSKREEINACAQTLQLQVDSSLENLLSMTISEKCRKLHQLTICIFRSMGTCPTSTPRIMLLSLVRYARARYCN